MEGHFPRRPPLQLAFVDLSYSVKRWTGLGRVEKRILSGVSGAFRAGELTAIMGPSGAGKTTLLNILAGFVVSGSGGKVLVNGVERAEAGGMEKFKRVSAYIQQDDEVRARITVREAMTIASRLKLGTEHGQQRINDLLEMLGLKESLETMCGSLSGGQKKRLSIALELITNPPILFLDEPTTGLDSSSTTSTVSLLRELAVGQGRTVVCTIHQPSALIFDKFSHLYFVARGRSLYQGPPSAVTHYFLGHGLRCPPYHNPADFIIEVSVGEYGCDLEAITESAEKSGQARAEESVVKNGQKGMGMFKRKRKQERKKNKKEDKKEGETEENGKPIVEVCLPREASLLRQTLHLYTRNIITLRRDITQIILRGVAHLIIALVFGYLYKKVGDDAHTLFANYIYIYGSNLFLHYTAQMAVLLSFPMEYRVLTREHFNRWYSLGPYLAALLLVEIPFQMACSLVYIAPSYYLTGQPPDWFRFALFTLFNLSITFTAQGTGFLAGAIFPVTVAVFIAPVTTVFLSVFGFTSHYDDVPWLYRPLYNMSYFRAALHGSTYALYGFGRKDLPCDEFYCHYRKPTLFLSEMGFLGFDTSSNIAWVLSFGGAMYALMIISVWYRLNKR